MDLGQAVKLVPLVLAIKDLTTEPVLPAVLRELAGCDVRAAEMALSDASESDDPNHHQLMAITLLRSAYAEYSASAFHRPASFKDRIRSWFNVERTHQAQLDAVAVALCIAHLYELRGDPICLRWARRANEALEQAKLNFSPIEVITEARTSSVPGHYKLVPVEYRNVQHPRWPEVERLGHQISGIVNRNAVGQTPLIRAKHRAVG